MVSVEKRCFLAVRHNTLLKQAIKSLLMDMADNLEVLESKAIDSEELLKEVSITNPDILLLEEASLVSRDSLMTCLFIARPGLPIFVISEDDNTLHIVRCETIQLSSSTDFLNAINFT